MVKARGFFRTLGLRVRGLWYTVHAEFRIVMGDFVRRCWVLDCNQRDRNDECTTRRPLFETTCPLPRF
jgi:hypothetical protein